MTTLKTLTQNEIMQRQIQRNTALQEKTKYLKCAIRDENGKSHSTHTGAIRILMYGGAKKAGDNKGFKGAAENVLADYIADKNDTLCCYCVMLTGGITQLVKYIENQSKNSIQSLDIFTHGAQDSLHTVIGSNLTTNKDDNVKRSIIHQTHRLQIEDYTKYPLTRDFNDQYDIGDLDLDRFTESCKIEIHGCNTAAENDNFARTLSIALYQAGKKRAVVIAHPDKISGNILNAPLNLNGEFTIPFAQYDYRHGKRVLYHNGKILHTFTKTGRLTATDINQHLKKVMP